MSEEGEERPGVRCSTISSGADWGCAGAGRHRRRAEPSKRRWRRCGRHGCPTLAPYCKRRNLLAHAPERLHEEISNDCRDMICARDAARVGTRREAFIHEWRSNASNVGNRLEEADDGLFTFTRFPPRRGNRSRPRTRSNDCLRNSETPNQVSDHAALRRKPPYAVLGAAHQDRSPCARSTDSRP